VRWRCPKQIPRAYGARDDRLRLAYEKRKKDKRDAREIPRAYGARHPPKSGSFATRAGARFAQDDIAGSL